MSNTNPLPAQTLLRLADAMADAAWDYPRGTDEKRNDALDVALSAYRAARAASPVTLEEALMVAERHAYHRAGSGRYFDPDMLDDWRIATGALIQHARRLAGEGGGK